MVEVDRRHVGERSQKKVQADADDRAHEPSHLDIRERRGKLVDLAGEKQKRHVGGEHKTDELGSARGLLLVGVSRLLLRGGRMPSGRGPGKPRLGSSGPVRGLGLGGILAAPVRGDMGRAVFDLGHEAPVSVRRAPPKLIFKILPRTSRAHDVRAHLHRERT